MTVSENSSDTGLSVLNTTSDNSNHQTTAANDATISVDGMTITRASNSIQDLFDGYTLSLSGTTTSAFRISSSLDETSALDSMKEFVASYNKTRKVIEDLTKVGDNPENSGPLSDDITIKNIKNQLNKLINGKLIGFDQHHTMHLHTVYKLLEMVVYRLMKQSLKKIFLEILHHLMQFSIHPIPQIHLI